MDSPASSKVGNTFVGRIIVLIPLLDYVILERVKESILTSKGNPDSTRVEILAARRAKEICIQKGITNYVILTDSLGAAEHSGIEGRQVFGDRKSTLCKSLLGQDSARGAGSAPSRQ